MEISYHQVSVKKIHNPIKGIQFGVKLPQHKLTQITNKKAFCTDIKKAFWLKKKKKITGLSTSTKCRD